MASAESTPVGTDSGLPRAALLVLSPSGQRSRVTLTPLPFLIGRHADNNLVLRDNRVSRTHSRIFAEDSHYVIEDLSSRHGTFINGQRAARHVLRDSDRIDFGVRESYQITFTVDPSEINRLMDRMTTSLTGTESPNNLEKLRSLMEVAR